MCAVLALMAYRRCPTRLALTAYKTCLSARDTRKRGSSHRSASPLLWCLLMTWKMKTKMTLPRCPSDVTPLHVRRTSTPKSTRGCRACWLREKRHSQWHASPLHSTNLGVRRGFVGASSRVGALCGMQAVRTARDRARRRRPRQCDQCRRLLSVPHLLQSHSLLPCRRWHSFRSPQRRFFHDRMRWQCRSQPR